MIALPPVYKLDKNANAFTCVDSFSNHHHACCKDLFIQQPTSMLTKISIKEESSIEQLITLQSSINYHVRENWEEVDWPSDAPQHLPWACQDHRDQEGRAGEQFLCMLIGKFYLTLAGVAASGDQEVVGIPQGKELAGDCCFLFVK